jgi:hypothetical protein
VPHQAQDERKSLCRGVSLTREPNWASFGTACDTEVGNLFVGVYRADQMPSLLVCGGPAFRV